jgi:cysteinyl-tRNA synthetase
MDDDFNTPQAIAVLFDLSREVNQALAADAAYGRQSLEAIDAFFDTYAGKVLGIEPRKSSLAEQGDDLAPALMDLVIGVRSEIRGQRLWGLSDKIRDGLLKLKIVLEDKKTGTSWKKVS